MFSTAPNDGRFVEYSATKKLRYFDVFSIASLEI